MKTAVDFSETTSIYVSINLGRTNVGVTEHFLDRSYVGAALKHVRGETMPQNMRRNPVRGDTDMSRPFADHLENPLAGKRPAKTGKKNVTGERGGFREGASRG